MAWPWWSAPTCGKSGREKLIPVDRSTIHFITLFIIFIYFQLFSYHCRHCHIPWKLLAQDNKAHNRCHAEENDEWSPVVVSTRRFLELSTLQDAWRVSNFTQLRMSCHTYHSCFQCKVEGQSQPMGWWPKPTYKLLSLALEFNGLRSLEIIKEKTQQIAIKDLGTSARKLQKVHSSWLYLPNIQRASNSNSSGMNNGSQTSFRPFGCTEF